MIPDMTTGIKDCELGIRDAQAVLLGGLKWAIHTFMMRSGLNVPTPAIPMPDLAVPYAAPMAVDIR